MMERMVRSLKEQHIHGHRFESLAFASRAIGDWIQFYNHKRPHQAFAMQTQNEAFRLAAKTEQIPPGQYKGSHSSASTSAPIRD